MKTHRKNRLTLIKEKIRQNHHDKWISHFLCECGNTKEIVHTLVVNGIIVDCGCGKFTKQTEETKSKTRLSLLTTWAKKSESGEWLNLYQCSCGNTMYCDNYRFMSGHTLSCGCLQKENLSKIAITHGFSKKEKLYPVWKAMRQRCNNPKDTSYKNYGGRGITISSDWDKYVDFREWAYKNGYEIGLSIERVDVNGDYCPSNCAWIPFKDQAKNTRRSIPQSKRDLIKSEYPSLTVKELHKKYNISEISVQRILSLVNY